MADSKMRKEWLAALRAATLAELLGQLSRTRAARMRIDADIADIAAELARRRGQIAEPTKQPRKKRRKQP